MKSDIYFKKGFTLIELLIVIAIIGILAAVLIPNLLSAREKAVDTAIKANLKTVQTTAAMYVSNNGGSYVGVCGPGPSAVGDILLNTAQKYLDPNATIADSAFGDFFYGDVDYGAVCHEDSTGWAAVISLKKPTISDAGWCVDSTGQSKEVTSLTSSGSGNLEIICP